MAGGRKPSGNEGMVREGPRTLESSGGLSAVPGWVAGCAGLRGPGRQRLRPAEWLGRFVCLCAAAHPQAARVGVASQPAASWGTGGRISRSNKVEDRSVGGGLRVWSLLRINKNESRRLGYVLIDPRRELQTRSPPPTERSSTLLLREIRPPVPQDAAGCDATPTRAAWGCAAAHRHTNLPSHSAGRSLVYRVLSIPRSPPPTRAPPTGHLSFPMCEVPLSPSLRCPTASCRRP